MTFNAVSIVSRLKFGAARLIFLYISQYQLFQHYLVRHFIYKCSKFLQGLKRANNQYYSKLVGERVHVIQAPPLVLQPVVFSRCVVERSSILEADCKQVGNLSTSHQRLLIFWAVLLLFFIKSPALINGVGSKMCSQTYQGQSCAKHYFIF